MKDKDLRQGGFLDLIYAGLIVAIIGIILMPLYKVAVSLVIIGVFIIGFCGFVWICMLKTAKRKDK